MLRPAWRRAGSRCRSVSRSTTLKVSYRYSSGVPIPLPSNWSTSANHQAMAPQWRSYEHNRETALLSDLRLPAEQIARERRLAPSTVWGVIKWCHTRALSKMLPSLYSQRRSHRIFSNKRKAHSLPIPILPQEKLPILNSEIYYSFRSDEPSRIQTTRTQVPVSLLLSITAGILLDQREPLGQECIDGYLALWDGADR